MDSWKALERWDSDRMEQPISLTRWGHYGVPVLVFPTAGGDAEEIERHQLLGHLASFIQEGRIKVYSCDSVAGEAWASGQHSAGYCSLLQNRFDSFVYEEVVPATRVDMRSDAVEIVAAGASIGAFNAMASLCRHPDVFRTAIARRSDPLAPRRTGGERARLDGDGVLAEGAVGAAVDVVGERVGQVLAQRAAERDVEDLQAAADPEAGQVPAGRLGRERELEGVALGRRRERLRMRLGAVVLGVQVRAAREQEPVHRAVDHSSPEDRPCQSQAIRPRCRLLGP